MYIYFFFVMKMWDRRKFIIVFIEALQVIGNKVLVVICKISNVKVISYSKYLYRAFAIIIYTCTLDNIGPNAY